LHQQDEEEAEDDLSDDEFQHGGASKYLNR